MPTPPANPNLKIVPGMDSTFRAEDGANGRFFIFGTLSSGLLRFEVVAQLSDGTRGAVKGREFFDALMSHFGAKVRCIEANWSRLSGLTTNLDRFNQATAAGLMPEQAALVASKTGQWADDYGFANVSVIDLDPPNAKGNYDKVVIHFSR